VLFERQLLRGVGLSFKDPHSLDALLLLGLRLLFGQSET
jgi:hypothetical protein